MGSIRAHKALNPVLSLFLDTYQPEWENLYNYNSSKIQGPEFA